MFVFENDLAAQISYYDTPPAALGSADIANVLTQAAAPSTVSPSPPPDVKTELIHFIHQVIKQKPDGQTTRRSQAPVPPRQRQPCHWRVPSRYNCLELLRKVDAPFQASARFHSATISKATRKQSNPKIGRFSKNARFLAIFSINIDILWFFKPKQSNRHDIDKTSTANSNCSDVRFASK
ncbi:hypothetical protein [Chromobacterium sp. Panama]|uniref:hypothetical protein n=1 Tax=Chromobacterium sp. Panama TaxID=2161826 RepID=UPI0011B1DE13|nr:hypothetical protein [Chromobacterium sp. Panama]